MPGVIAGFVVALACVFASWLHLSERSEEDERGE